MYNLPEVLDALPVQAAHARERDGVVTVAPSEYTCEMAIHVATTVRLRPDDEVRLMRMLDDDGVKSYPRGVLRDLDEAARLGVARRHRTWNAIEARGFGADNVVGQHGRSEERVTRSIMHGLAHACAERPQARRTRSERAERVRQPNADAMHATLASSRDDSV